MKNPLKRRPKDPEGRMPLKEHFLELRNRLFKCALALIVGAIVGWQFYNPMIEAVQEPLLESGKKFGRAATLNFAGVISPFDLKIQMSIFMGIILASPVWIYQFWAFITPGLTKKERRFSLAFMFSSIPLFLAGCALAWYVLPYVVNVMTAFIPSSDNANLIPARDYLNFITRLMLAFGISFLVPVVLVGLNILGILPSRALVRSWRIVVFLVCLFAAIAAPGADAMSMFFLAGPLLVLFFGAIGLTVLLDRRKAKRAAARSTEIEATADRATSLEELKNL